MIVVDYEPAHADDILQGRMNDERGRPSEDLGHFTPALAADGMAFTALENGHVIACAGIYKLWSGVGEAWLLASERIHNNRIGVARAVRLGMKNIIDEQEFWRVQTAMRSDWPLLERWAKFLGMKHEGSMRKFGVDGSDWERWAWVNGN